MSSATFPRADVFTPDNAEAQDEFEGTKIEPQKAHFEAYTVKASKSQCCERPSRLQFCRMRLVEGDVTVMVPGFAQTLFLLSPALHWAVLINTNAWYGCEELKSRRLKRVCNAKNFDV